MRRFGTGIVEFCWLPPTARQSGSLAGAVSTLRSERMSFGPSDEVGERQLPDGRLELLDQFRLGADRIRLMTPADA